MLAAFEAAGVSSLHGVRVRVNTSGQLELFSLQAGIGILYTTAALTANQWYQVEVGWMIASGAGDDYAELKLDGVSLFSSTTTNIGTSVHLQVAFHTTSGGGINMDTDDVALNDNQGASQNTFPGEGKVVLCVPISDSQDGSWTGGAGGVGDLSTAVDNKPPIGTAAETDLTQIESIDASGDNATDEYRANLTTYTNAGIGASDTITLIQPIINHGEDVSTGTKTGSFGMQANPAAAYATFTFGDDAGALGTWATNWRTAYGTPSYAPSVTLGSSPVLAVRKTDTGTRVASVDAMGLYVEYVAAASPPVLVIERPNFIYLRKNR